MDVEFDIQYKHLLVHYLVREELEYELAIRGIEYTDTETRATLARRLKGKIKTEREQNNFDLDFNRLDATVESEIEIIDTKIKEIQDYLGKRKSFEGTRESLKTRLVHYLARVKRIYDYTDKEEDLKDIEALESCIRNTFNSYFSCFSVMGQQEIISKISQSVTNMSLGNAGSNNQESSSSGDEIFATPGKHLKRKLKSVEGSSGHQLAQQNTMMPFWMPPEAIPWMLYQQQWWAAQMCSNHSLDNGARLPGDPRYTSDGKLLNKKKVELEHMNKGKNEKIQVNATSSSEIESGGSDDYDRKELRRKPRHRKIERGRPVSDWKLKYDGADNGQFLMKFIKEVDFVARSENMSQKELFRQAIHLFSGTAKTWFMTGIENEDFNSWNELKEELKREFLSPDHDHMNENRAIARKQGPREKFQEYLLEMQKIFNSLTKPLTERKKFEIVFRNMRADYKGHAVSSDIDNLADLKVFGRRLDATYWYKYQQSGSELHSRGKQLQTNEIYAGARPKQKNEQLNMYKSRSFTNSRFHTNVSEGEEIPLRNSDTDLARYSRQPKGLQILLDNYKPPKEGYCYNCRLMGHHARDCERPKHKFCIRCGFHDVDTATCPYCEKNAKKTVSEGRQLERT